MAYDNQYLVSPPLIEGRKGAPTTSFLFFTSLKFFRLFFQYFMFFFLIFPLFSPILSLLLLFHPLSLAYALPLFLRALLVLPYTRKSAPWPRTILVVVVNDVRLLPLSWFLRVRDVLLSLLVSACTRVRSLRKESSILSSSFAFYNLKTRISLSLKALMSRHLFPHLPYFSFFIPPL